MDKTIYRIVFGLGNTVDVDVSKHMTSVTQWTHKKIHSAKTVKDMNKKKKHKD